MPGGGISVVVAAPTQAQPPPGGPELAVLLGKAVQGFRVGVSSNPDQFYIGAHFRAGPIARKVWFRPNLEVGIGDSVTTVALNGEFAYFAPSPWKSSDIYFGASPAMKIYVRSGATQKADVDPGFNMLVGVARRGKGLLLKSKAASSTVPRSSSASGIHSDDARPASATI
jgi:hypothetical protein